MLTQVLQEYGLNDKQANVYLKTLELGTTPVSTIARYTGLNRVTVYDILKSLQAMGLATTMKKKNTTYYSVVSPEVMQATLEQKLKKFTSAVPELMALADKFGNKPTVQFFEGYAGLKKIYDDQVHSATDILAFVGPGIAHDQFKTFLRDVHVPERVKNKVFAKVIVPQSNKDSEWYKSKDKEYYKETREIKDPIFSLHNEIDIYGPNKVAISLYNEDEMSGLIIHSKSLYQAMKNIFEVIWRGLEK